MIKTSFENKGEFNNECHKQVQKNMQSIKVNHLYVSGP